MKFAAKMDLRIITNLFRFFLASLPSCITSTKAELINPNINPQNAPVINTALMGKSKFDQINKAIRKRRPIRMPEIKPNTEKYTSLSFNILIPL